LAPMAENKSPRKFRVFVIHGPNLNLLGRRDPQHYGRLTLDKLNKQIRRKAQELGVDIRIVQTNREGRIIELLHRRRKWADAFILNPAAYTHYSFAIRDAVEAIGKPVVEVHLSDIFSREPFRRVSVIAPVCQARFYGRKVDSYLEALEWVVEQYATPEQRQPRN